jgi:hypothetical protein
MKIYVVAREALGKNGRQGETQFITEIDSFSNCLPSSPLNVDFYFFLEVSFESHPVYDQTQCFGAIFCLFNKYFY